MSDAAPSTANGSCPRCHAGTPVALWVTDGRWRGWCPTCRYNGATCCSEDEAIAIFGVESAPVATPRERDLEARLGGLQAERDRLTDELSTVRWQRNLLWDMVEIAQQCVDLCDCPVRRLWARALTKLPPRAAADHGGAPDVTTGQETPARAAEGDIWIAEQIAREAGLAFAETLRLVARLRYWERGRAQLLAASDEAKERSG